MTTAAEELQRTLARSWAAWAGLARAWQATVQELNAAVAEWAYEEDVPIKFGSGRVTVTPTRPMRLSARLHASGDPQRRLLPETCVTIEPAELDVPQDGSAPAGVRVVVTVTAPDDELASAYEGSLVDQDGNVVEDTVFVPMLK